MLFYRDRLTGKTNPSEGFDGSSNLSPGAMNRSRDWRRYRTQTIIRNRIRLFEQTHDYDNWRHYRPDFWKLKWIPIQYRDDWSVCPYNRNKFKEETRRIINADII